MKPARLDHLDGIRGIAAFSVMLGHVKWPSAITHLPVFTSVTLWVDFFFVLSGFVIARSYLDRLAEGYGVGQFMWRRFARLYPLHLLTLFAALAYEIAKWKFFGAVSLDAKHTPFEHNTAFSFVCNLLLVQALGILPESYWNGPSWSISVEFYVYLVFALCVAVTRQRRSLFWTLLIGLQALSFATLVLYSGGRSVETDYGFFRCIVGFNLGVLVEHFCRNREIPAKSPKSWLNLLMAGAVLALVSTPVEGTRLMLVAPFIFGLAVWMLVQYRGGLVERVLLSPACQTLGALSYSIYMTHGVILSTLRLGWRMLARQELFRDGWGALLLNEGLTFCLIGLVLLVSSICYRRVELPAQRWLNQLADRPRKATVPALEVPA